MDTDLKSLHRVELYPDMLARIDDYIGDGRVDTNGVAPLRTFLHDCVFNGPDYVPDYAAYAAVPTLKNSTQTIIECMVNDVLQESGVGHSAVRSRDETNDCLEPAIVAQEHWGAVQSSRGGSCGPSNMQRSLDNLV